ncbi:sodium/potassium-transporting ATPase subunit beta-3a [Sardina pilchardus]|uniref:sodium/potassium-transporting ATPase subunit beta-3a n=1 Tax=Sardina pilchardus TaxID=27697 RepID=UPI002E15B255
MTKDQVKPGDEKEYKTSWTDSIYNSRTGEFVGRTARSWGLIILFYLVFYAFLAGFFCLTMWAMLQTLSDDVPKYRDRVPSPGLVIRPKSLDIVYNRSDVANYDQYIQHLDSFLQRYDDEEQASNELCARGEYFMQEAPEVEKKACQFRRSSLSRCSGLSDDSYGYADGKPCVLVKMNRIIGLLPRGEPYLNCTAKGVDPPRILYYPSAGRFDKMYFPYYGKKTHARYVQPVVAVKLHLTKENYNKELTIECKVDGSDLRNNDERDKSLGRVTFRVLVTE